MAMFSDAYQAEVAAVFSRETQEAQSVAILTQTGDEHSEVLSEVFATHFTALGGSVVAWEQYNASDTDFTPQLTRIAAEVPDVIFLPGSAPEVPLIVEQARQTPQPYASGITATFLGSNRWDSPAITQHQSMRDSFYIGAFAFEASQEFPPPPDAIFIASEIQFIAGYTSMFGIPPDGSAAIGYDVVKLVVTAMRRAGQAVPSMIRDQIAATHQYRGATTFIGYDENRIPTKNAIVLRIDDEPYFHQRFDP